MSVQKRLADGLNPIVVKELRQLVRSRFVIGANYSLLFLLLAVSGVYLIGANVRHATSLNFNFGKPLFMVLFACLAGITFTFVPLYTSLRLALERDNMDLLYITSLRSGAVIRGKMMSAIMLMLLLFSICMPYMAFTYMLRGIDLGTIFFLMIYVFCVTLGLTQAMTLLACLPTQRMYKYLLMGIGALFMGTICLFTLIGVLEWLDYGELGDIYTARFRNKALVLFSLSATLFLLLHLLTVAVITPPSFNRALPLRLYSTLLWAISGLVMGWLSFHHRDGSYMVTWTVCVTVACIVALLAVISEPERLSTRVRRTIPRHHALRYLALLFYNGTTGGLVWVFDILLLTFTIAFYISFQHVHRSWSVHDYRQHLEVWRGAVTLGVYFMAYALTALALRNLFRHWLPHQYTWICCLFLVALGVILPALSHYFVDQDRPTDLFAWYMGNIFDIANRTRLNKHLVFALTWAILGLTINYRWFCRQYQQFKPPDQAEVLPLADLPGLEKLRSSQAVKIACLAVRQLLVDKNRKKE